MKTRTIIFSAFNLFVMFCLIINTLLARHSVMAQGRDSFDFGDSMSFIFLVIPLLFLCSIADIVWTFMVGLEIYRKFSLRPAVALAIVVVLWATVIFTNRKLSDIPSQHAMLTTAE